MSCLVGTLVLNGGEKVVITFDDGRKLKGIYIETYGYNHIFRLSNGNDMKLSNHFMHLKGTRPGNPQLVELAKRQVGNVGSILFG